MVWVDDTRFLALEDPVAAYEDRTGVAVDLVSRPFEEVVAGVLAAERPDIFIASHDQIDALLDAEAIAPLDVDASAFDPQAIQAVSRSGIIYAVPYGLEAVALYVNEGVVPADADTESFASLEGSCDSFDGCVGAPDDAYHLYGFLGSSGGYVFARMPGGAWASDDVGLSDGVDGATSLVRLVADGVVAPGPYREVVGRFDAGEVPFLITGPWQLRAFADADVAFTVKPLPMVDGRGLRPFVGVQAFFVGADAPADVAAAFVREVLSVPEVSRTMALADDRVPAMISARTDLEPSVIAFIESVDSGDLLPDAGLMETAWDPLGDAFDAILTGVDPAMALSDAEAQIRGDSTP